MTTQKNIQNVADLACLSIDENEVNNTQENFDKIIKYFDRLNQLNTEGVTPMVTPHQQSPDLRVDEVSKQLTRDEILENAPDVKDSLFKVPPVV